MGAYGTYSFNRTYIALGRVSESIEMTVDYVMTFWHYPNFDCWEEYPDYVPSSYISMLIWGAKSAG